MEPQVELTQTLFGGVAQSRFPNLVVAMDGSFVATWGGWHDPGVGAETLWSRRSADGGRTWEPPVVIDHPAIQGGGTLVDETTGEIFCFTQPGHSHRQPEPPTPRRMFVSADHGCSWREREAQFLPDANGYIPALHMAETGITLHRGPRPGRLIRPARVYWGDNHRGEVHYGYNTAIYSDDHGATWVPSAPFPDTGTGEGAVVELADGTLYYNSRKQYFPEEEPAHPWRHYALSRDGGETWEGPFVCRDLPDGPRHRGPERNRDCFNGHYGILIGLDLLRDPDGDILLASGPDDAEARRANPTVWASRDGGKSWPFKLSLGEVLCAYSSLCVGRPGTASEGTVAVLYECGERNSFDGALTLLSAEVFKG